MEKKEREEKLKQSDDQNQDAQQKKTATSWHGCNYKKERVDWQRNVGSKKERCNSIKKSKKGDLKNE